MVRRAWVLPLLLLGACGAAPRNAPYSLTRDDYEPEEEPFADIGLADEEIARLVQAIVRPTEVTEITIDGPDAPVVFHSFPGFPTVPSEPALDLSLPPDEAWLRLHPR